jgi:hypothetical protein
VIPWISTSDDDVVSRSGLDVICEMVRDNAIWYRWMIERIDYSTTYMYILLTLFC